MAQTPETKNKLKYAFFIILVVCVIIGVSLGIYYGTRKSNDTNSSSTPSKTLPSTDNSQKNSTGTTSGTTSGPTSTSSTSTNNTSGNTGGSTSGSDSNSGSTGNNLVCLQNFSNFTRWDSSFSDSSFNVNSLVNSTNQTNLKSYCDAGLQIINQKCNLATVNPSNSAGFRKFCCNNSVDPSQCSSTANTCILDKAQFATKAYGYSADFNESSLNNIQNLADMSDFCSLGTSILSNKCAIDENYPMNNTSFTKYCCKGSTDPTKCDVSNLKCLQSSGAFLNSDYSLKDLTPSSITANLDEVNTFCQIGNDMLSSGCTSITNPINSSTFQKLCCNNTVDPNVCKSNGSCLADAGQFLTQDYNMQNINPNSLGPNASAVKAYCDVGIDMQKNNCTSVTIPINSSTFRKLCCNNSVDPNQCNSSGLQCAVDASNFQNKSYDLQNIASNPSSIGANIDSITAFCAMGSSLINNCSSVVPKNDSTYRALCM